MGPQEMGLGCKSYFYESELIQLLFRGIGYFGPHTNQIILKLFIEPPRGVTWDKVEQILIMIKNWRWH